MALSAKRLPRILLLHFYTYNDATFVTSFWVALWMLWFSFQAPRQTEHFHLHACFLAQLIISVIFFSGFIGKLTVEYWNGSTMYGLFCGFFNHWPFNSMKENLSVDELRSVATYVSRSIIIIELLISTCFLWPQRKACLYIPFLLLGMIFFRNWQILSVLACLMGLLWACVLIVPAKAPDTEEEC